MRPVVLIGIGETGRAIAGLAGAANEGAAPAQVLLYREGADWFADGAASGWPAVQTTLGDWLHTAFPPGAQEQRVVDVLFYSALAEPDAPALLLLGRKLNTRLAEVFPAIHWHTEALLLLPEGACEGGPQVAAILEELEDARAAATLPFRPAWLIAPCSPTARLTPGDLTALAAHFTALRRRTDLASRLAGVPELADPAGGFAGLGLAALEVPGRRLARSLARKFALVLAEEGLRAPDDRTPAARAAAAAFSAGWLGEGGLPALRTRMLERDGGGSVEQDVSPGAFLFDQVPQNRWPSSLAGFDAFVRRERLGSALDTIDRNAARVLGELTAGLRQAVDAQVMASRDQGNALAFLASVHADVDGLRVAVATAGGVLEAETDVKPLLRALREAIATQPEPSAAWVKGALLAILLSLPAQAVLNQAAVRFGASVAWLTAPLQWALGLGIGAVVGLGLAWRALQAARQAIDTARDRAAGAVERNARARLQARAQSRVNEVLEALHLLTLDRDRLQREHPEYTGPNEAGEVIDLRERIAEIPGALTVGLGDTTATWRLDATEVLGARRVDFPYRNRPEFDDWPGEADDAVAGGYLQGWRTITPFELADRLEAHTRRGMAYLESLTLDAFLQGQPENGEGEQRLRTAYNRLVALSAPLVLAPGDAYVAPPGPLAVAAASNGPLLQRLHHLGGLGNVIETALPGAHPQEFTLLQFAMRLDCGRLEGLPTWKRGQVVTS